MSTDRRTEPWEAAAYAASFDFVPRHGREVVELLRPAPGERVLDLGCGTGTLTAAIAERGANVVGLDSDAEMLRVAREQHPGLLFQQGDALQYEASEPFDAVFSNAMLHWVTQPEALLRRVASWVRPGGRFVAELGGRGNVATVFEALRKAIEEAGVPREEQAQPWYFPSPGVYASLLEAHGFEVRWMALFDRPTPLEGGAAGLRAWIEMFAPTLLAPLDPAARTLVLERVERATRPSLWRDGRWWADYRRLRFVAVRSTT